MPAPLRTPARAAAVALIALFTAALATASPSAAATCTPISAFPAPPAGAPLPGSCFEGWDGDQVDSDGQAPGDPAPADRIDWGSPQVLAGAQRALDYTQGAADSQFTGGAEETPDSWTFGVGSLGSDKYDLISGYSYAEPDTQDLMLALAFVRESNNGASWLAFELNQKQPGYRSAPLAGASPAQTVAVPTRSTGDLLITYSVSNNNSPKPVVGLCKWVGDEHAGVWTDMAGVPVASNCPALSGSVAQADLNGADIPAAENVLGSPSGALVKGTFGEASVNLSEAFKAALADPATEDDCLSFGYFWAHSRSSEPITSAQQDFILPSGAIAAANCAVSGKKWHDKNGNGLLDGTDEGAGGWTIFADYDDDGVLDPGEPSDVSAPASPTDMRAPGTYLIDDLADGTYKIREVAQAGWHCTAPSPCATEVTMTGSLIDQVDFLNFESKPAIELTKTNVLNAPAAPKAGDTVTYSFEIENTGNVALSGVDLDDGKLGYADVACNAVTTLAPGAKTTCTGDYTLTQADVDAGSVRNEADACGDPPVGVEVCSPDTTTTLLAADPKIGLDKTATPKWAGAVKAGDTIEYGFKITNTGNVTLNNVTLDDDLLGLSDVVCETSQIAPGAAANCVRTYTLTQADVDAGSVHNDAEACGDGGNDTTVCSPDDTTTPLPPSPSLSLKKTGVLTAPAAPKPGDTIAYAFEITNTGTVTLTGVDLDDALVGKADAVCGAATLAPGAKTSCTAVYTLTQVDVDAGKVDNLADACGDSPKGAEVCAEDDTSTPLPPSPSLSLKKTASTGAAGAGDTITYTFEIANTGTVTLTGADLDDALVGFADATCGVATLAPGAKTSCTAVYTVTQDDVDAGKVTNAATACADPPNGAAVCDDDATTTTLDPARGILVVKDGPAVAYHGDQATYTFLVSNPGGVSLSGVTVADDRCAGVKGPELVKGDADAKLEPGEQWRYACTTTLGAHADGEANPIVNTVTATGKDPAGAAHSDTDTHETRLLHAAVQLDKTGPATAEAGARVQYALVVTNPGDTALAGEKIAVTDPKCDSMPVLAVKQRGDGADPTPDTLDPGDAWVYTCFVQTAAGETSVVNVASVAADDVNARRVSDDDDATTALTQPRIEVLPETVESGAARLRGPSRCVDRAFVARVRGKRIKSVVWSVDGRRVKTFRSRSGEATRANLRVRPERYGDGVHRLKARVTFTAAARTGARTLRMTFQRCAKQIIAPKFTG